MYLLFMLGIFCTFYDVVRENYFHHGMYVLIAQKAAWCLNRATLVAALISLIIAAESSVLRLFAQRKKKVAASPAGVLTAAILLYGLVIIYYDIIIDLSRKKSLVVYGCIFLFSCLLWFFCRKLDMNRLFILSKDRISAYFIAGIIIVILLVNVVGRGWYRFWPDRSPNIVFIGVDTLRADHMGCYGYAQATTPNIDAWASKSTVFHQCITSTPRTTQSLASIVTSKYPYAINVRNLYDTIPKKELTLAEVLKNNGYQTIAVIATGIPYKKN